MTEREMKNDIYSKLKAVRSTLLPNGFSLSLVDDMYKGLSTPNSLRLEHQSSFTSVQ